MIERGQADDWSPYISLKYAGICVLSLISHEEMQLFQDVMRFLNQNVLPYEGGFLDQPAPFCQAVDVVAAELNKLRPKAK